MKIKYLIPLILLISFNVNATGIHRTHVTTFINDALVALSPIMGSVQNHGANNLTTSAGFNHLIQIQPRVNALVAKLNEALVALQDPDPKALFVVQRLLNQPRSEFISKNEPMSAAIIVKRLNYSVTHYICDTYYWAGDWTYNSTPWPGTIPGRQAILTVAFAWEQIDRAIWHISDAIREEVYNDLP